MSFWRRSAIKEVNYCAQNFIKMLYLKSEISPKSRYRLWLFNKVAKSLWINHLVSVIIFFIFKCGIFSTKKSSNQICVFLGRLFLNLGDFWLLSSFLQNSKKKVHQKRQIKNDLTSFLKEIPHSSNRKHHLYSFFL